MRWPHRKECPYSMHACMRILLHALSLELVGYQLLAVAERSFSIPALQKVPVRLLFVKADFTATRCNLTRSDATKYDLG